MPRGKGKKRTPGMIRSVFPITKTEDEAINETHEVLIRVKSERIYHDESTENETAPEIHHDEFETAPKDNAVEEDLSKKKKRRGRPPGKKAKEKEIIPITCKVKIERPEPEETIQESNDNEATTTLENRDKISTRSSKASTLCHEELTFNGAVAADSNLLFDRDDKAIPEITQTTLLTIDAANIGIQFEDPNLHQLHLVPSDSNVGMEVEIECVAEAPKPKKRGRKPKVKKEKATSETQDNGNCISFVPSPKIVNGIISIDMSHLKATSIPSESSQQQASSTTHQTELPVDATSIKTENQSEPKQKKPRKSKKKLETDERKPVKRTKANTSKENPDSTDVLSPIKVQVKRGRRMKIGPLGQTIRTTANRSSFSYSGISDWNFESDEVLTVEELVGFEHVETLNSESLERQGFQWEWDCC